MEKKEYIVNKDTMLIGFLQSCGLDYNTIMMCLRRKDIKVNSRRVRKNVSLCKADKVEIFYREKNIDLPDDIKVYEDDYVLIVNKMAKMESSGEDGLDVKLGVLSVHRLDRNTQGLIIYAKSEESRAILSRAIVDRSIIKRYVCEVYGDTDYDGRVYLAYHFKDAKKSLVYISDTQKSKYKPIKTVFTTVKHGKTSLVDCQLITGRTHQIRAQLAHMGHFIIGDNKYGNKNINDAHHAKFQRLYCYSISMPQFAEECMQGVSGKTFTVCPKGVEKWIN